MPFTVPDPKWAHETFNRDPASWEGAQREVRAQLVAVARRRSVITYLEIVDSITSTEIPSKGAAFAKAIGLLLGQVNLIESQRLGKPMMLSAVAVTNDLHPGAGFQGLVDDLGWKRDWTTWLAIVWRQYSGRI
ncbi:MAG: hypothetical protein ACYCYK_06370 [Candidatus Dormibacteria bacterium]